jgi:2-methylcitrate dehydratase PrpD
MTIETVATAAVAARLGSFATTAAVPAPARSRAASAMLDTIGVALAGAAEPATRVVRELARDEGGERCTLLGTAGRASAGNAALVNGTAAHALDFDDMCFVSLAHPSAPLVPALLAAAELADASGAAVLDAYTAGFEIEARLGRAMNPSHYQRGWHCTSTLGTIGAAAAASRLLELSAETAANALAIAASSASGLKENFGTMTKPLHAGLAARAGLIAALLARGGLTASGRAFEGSQGFLVAMDGARTGLDDLLADLGRRWEILETGIAVKLYPSCAGTHPTIEALLDLKREHGLSPSSIDTIEIRVDSVTPTVLIYEQPTSGLEAKFSLPFCAAAAIVDGEVGIGSFQPARLHAPEILAMMGRIRMVADPSLDGIAAPLTQARIAIRLSDGRVIARSADGARGYPERPASDAELDRKFLLCAEGALSAAAAASALAQIRDIERAAKLGTLLKTLVPAV